MKAITRSFLAAMFAACLAIGSTAKADTVITTFDNFNLDGLFAWSDATVTSGPTSYTIVDTGYGSGFEDINPNVSAAGNTHIQLTATLANGPSGPIVSLVDGDGTFLHYAWFGTPVGSHVLTKALNAPSFGDPIANFDFSTLDFFHLQNDPGANTGLYSVEFQDLRLIVPEPGSATLAGGALAGLIGLARRRRA